MKNIISLLLSCVCLVSVSNAMEDWKLFYNLDHNKPINKNLQLSYNLDHDKPINNEINMRTYDNISYKKGKLKENINSQFIQNKKLINDATKKFYQNTKNFKQLVNMVNYNLYTQYDSMNKLINKGTDANIINNKLEQQQQLMDDFYNIVNQFSQSIKSFSNILNNNNSQVNNNFKNIINDTITTQTVNNTIPINYNNININNKKDLNNDKDITNIKDNKLYCIKKGLSHSFDEYKQIINKKPIVNKKPYFIKYKNEFNYISDNKNITTQENQNKINIISEYNSTDNENINNQKVTIENSINDKNINNKKVDVNNNTNQEGKNVNKNKPKRKKKKTISNKKINEDIFQKFSNNNKDMGLAKYVIESIIREEETINGQDNIFCDITIKQWKDLYNKKYKNRKGLISDVYHDCKNQINIIEQYLPSKISTVNNITTNNTGWIDCYFHSIKQDIKNIINIDTINTSVDALLNNIENDIFKTIANNFAKMCQLIKQDNERKYRFITEVKMNTKKGWGNIYSTLVSNLKDNNEPLTYNEILLYKAFLCFEKTEQLLFRLKNMPLYLQENQDWCMTYYKLLIKQYQQDLAQFFNLN